MAKKKPTAGEVVTILFSTLAGELMALKVRVEKLEKQSAPPHLHNREVRG